MDSARSLLRTILRLHRELPALQRSLGDRVVHEEWSALSSALRRGKATPAQQQEFMGQWQQYALALRGGAATTGSEELVDEDALLQQLNPEQREQLRRLRAEAQKLRGDSRD